jgi:membrane fusion protein (multidrug efflux system)
MFLRRAAALRLLLLIGVPVVAAGAGLAIWQQGGRFISTDDAYVKTDIAQISPEVAGRVVEVAVRDQTTVKAGDLLLRLDPVPYQLALDKAEATLDAARIQVENARASYFETRSELGEVESQADYLQSQFQRQKELARTVYSATKLEEARTTPRWHATAERRALAPAARADHAGRRSGDPHGSAPDGARQEGRA